jgi:hypothetical protein
MEAWLHVILISTIDEVEWSASRPGRFAPGGRTAGIHWIGGWVNPRTGLDSTPQYVFMAWRLVKNRENFTLLLSHLLDFRNRIQAYTCLF